MSCHGNNNILSNICSLSVNKTKHKIVKQLIDSGTIQFSYRYVDDPLIPIKPDALTSLMEKFYKFDPKPHLRLLQTHPGYRKSTTAAIIRTNRLTKKMAFAIFSANQINIRFFFFLIFQINQILIFLFSNCSKTMNIVPKLYNILKMK